MVHSLTYHQKLFCLQTVIVMSCILSIILFYSSKRLFDHSILAERHQALLNKLNIQAMLLSRQRMTLNSLTSIELHRLDEFKNDIVNQLNSRRVVNIIIAEQVLNERNVSTDCVVKPDCPKVPPDLEEQMSGYEFVWRKRDEIVNDLNFSRTPHEGKWSPECTSRHSVAIVVPYRGRRYQLAFLLEHLPAVLKRQKISYSIFVVEQVGNGTFNKGIIMNAGFLSALVMPAHGVTYHCFIFHDVDLLPEDDRNMYTCPPKPRHLSIAVDEFSYKLPYRELTGGVFAIRTEHFFLVNGYSNLYWGWGAEDDDMGLRVEKVFGNISRPPEQLGRYFSVPHAKRKSSSRRLLRRLISTAQTRYRVDGLTTVQYKVVDYKELRQFTHLLIDVGEAPDERDSHIADKPPYDLMSRLNNVGLSNEGLVMGELPLTPHSRSGSEPDNQLSSADDDSPQEFDIPSENTKLII